MSEPALYICPYCTAKFSHRTEGWKEATKHIRLKHKGRSAGKNVPFSDHVPRDNLFGSIGSPSRGLSF